MNVWFSLDVNCLNCAGFLLFFAVLMHRLATLGCVRQAMSHWNENFMFLAQRRLATFGHPPGARPLSWYRRAPFLDGQAPLFQGLGATLFFNTAFL